MGIRISYLREFCEEHGILKYRNKIDISSPIKKSRLRYNFGIPTSKINGITTIKGLENAINKYAQIPIEADEDINHEAIELYDSLVI